MEFLGEPLRAVTEPIDRILNAVIALCTSIFTTQSGGDYINGGSWIHMLIYTIVNNQYLLISLSLVLCGFVIGVLKRVISL